MGGRKEGRKEGRWKEKEREREQRQRPRKITYTSLLARTAIHPDEELCVYFRCTYAGNLLNAISNTHGNFMMRDVVMRYAKHMQWRIPISFFCEHRFE